MNLRFNPNTKHLTTTFTFQITEVKYWTGINIINVSYVIKLFK